MRYLCEMVGASGRVELHTWQTRACCMCLPGHAVALELPGWAVPAESFAKGFLPAAGELAAWPLPTTCFVEQRGAKDRRPLVSDGVWTLGARGHRCSSP